MTVHEITTGGIAALASPSDGQTPVSGVLIGEGDITNGLSGKRTRWPADVLRDMVGVFDGKPLTMADSNDPEQHVGVEMTDDGARLSGAVSMDEKVGEITDTVYEDGVGLLYEGFVADDEASAAVQSNLAQVSPVIMRDVEPVNGDLHEVTEVFGGRDVAIVADGAVPSNDITTGALPETAEALATHFDADVAVLTDDNRGGDDGSNGGQGQSTPADDDTFTMDLTDREQELVAAARQKDDPTVVEAEVPDRLSELEATISDHEDLLAEAGDIDDPTVMDADEAEAMQDRVAIVEEMMAEALTDQKGLREATVDAMSFDAMAAEFQSDDGDLDVEALTQSPESGSAPTGGDGGDGPTDEDIDRIAEIDQKLSTVGTSLPDNRVEALREEAADLADAEDYDGALEVL